MGLRRAQVDPNLDGMYELASAPDCTEPYRGGLRGAWVYVVGMGTDQERIYRRSERKEALTYARAGKLTVNNIGATELCHDTMMELLGA